MSDVLVIGGGIAGLAAALMLGRSHRHVVVIDSGEPRNAPARQMHNVLTREGTPPAEFRRLALRELDAHPGVTVRAGVVRTVSAGSGSVGPGFAAVLADGERVDGRRLLLATGLADDLPPVPGMAEAWGISAFHCPYCHGWEVSGRALAVLGAALPRVRLALQLSRFSDDVVLCADGADLTPQAAEALARAGVAVRPEPVAALDVRQGVLEAVAFAEGPVLPRAALFVASRPRQRSDLAAVLGCAVLDDGCVEVDEFGRTDVAGVYAAGDMAHRATLPMPLASVTAAGAAGQVAAGALDQDLLSDDAGLPQPFPVARPQ